MDPRAKERRIEGQRQNFAENENITSLSFAQHFEMKNTHGNGEDPQPAPRWCL